jgi:hypothetical protein
MLEVWASTGLEFDSSAYDKLQLGRNVNAFIAKRCNVQVDENREELLQLGNFLEESEEIGGNQAGEKAKKKSGKTITP